MSSECCIDCWHVGMSTQSQQLMPRNPALVALHPVFGDPYVSLALRHYKLHAIASTWLSGLEKASSMNMPPECLQAGLPAGL